MNQSSFSDVKDCVQEWVNESMARFRVLEVCVEVQEDTKDAYWVVVFFKRCLGQIVVAKPGFAPYRFVRFEAYSTETDLNEAVYFWGDGHNDDCETVKEQLSKAIEFCAAY